MSYTGEFKEIISLKEGTPGVKILDLAGLECFVDKFSDCNFIIDTDERKCGDKYPPLMFKFLLGFKTRQDDKYFISRFCYEQDKEKFVEFWGKVSTFTEPFRFLHASTEGFKTSDRIYEHDKEDWVYEVICTKGKVQIQQITIGITKEEVLP